MDTIIIFRIGSLGDTAVALPCFHQIARRFANSRRILLTDVPASQKAASVKSILGDSGLIDGVIDFPPPPRNVGGFLRLRAQIRKTNAKTLIYIADRNIFSTLRDLCFFRWCGIRHVIGAPLRYDLRRPRTDPQTGEIEYEAVRLARCLAPLGPIDLNDRALWDLRLQAAEIDAADKNLAPLAGRQFVAINAGGKNQSKDWGNDNWAAFLRLMAGRYSSLAVLFIGSLDEFNRSEELAAAWPGQTLNLCGFLSPRESAAAMKQAILFVGHDSGPMHLAAAAGAPCVALFGNFNRPKWWHPMGRGHRIIHNMKGVMEITPDEVYSAVSATIAENPERMRKSMPNSVSSSVLAHAQ